MPPAYVKDLGSANSKSSSTTLVLTLGVTAAVGNCVLVAVGGITQSTDIASCADSQGNTYVRLGGQSYDLGVGRSAIFASILTTGLGVGDTITATWASAVSTRVMAAIEASGITSTTLDGSTPVTVEAGASASMSVGPTATTSNANDFLWAMWLVSNGTATFDHTPDSPWAESQLATTGNTGTNRSIGTQYRVVSATGAYTATSTQDASRAYDGIIVALQGAGAGGPWTVEIGIATETDTAPSVTGLKTKTIGLATETDTALPVTGGVTPPAPHIPQPVRATYSVKIAWDPQASGIFTIGVSEFDGPGVLAGFFDATFTGPFDDVTEETMHFRVQRGRDDNLQPMRAGECEIVLFDPDGKFNPTNESSPLAGQVIPMRQILIEATFDSVTYSLFRGFLRSVEHDPVDRLTTVNGVDLFLWLDRVAPTLDTVGAETTGSAIERILDDIGFTNPDWRDLDEGDDIPGFVADGQTNAVTLIEDLLEYERGVFFINASGTAVYQNRLHRTLAASSGTVSGQMSDLHPAIDLDRIYNRVKVVVHDAFLSLLGGGTAIAEDQDSIDLYGVADFPVIDSEYVVDGTQGVQLANYVLSQARTAVAPVRGMLMFNRGSALFIQMLARELGDRVTISESRSSTTGDYLVEQITHEVTEGGTLHKTTWGLTERGADAFLIGVSQLDSDDQLVY